MFPQMASALRGWTKPSQMRVVKQTPADFEVFEDVIAVEWFDVFLTPMSAQKVDRKPEDLRIWKWWEGYTTTDIAPDTVVQDFNGTQFRVQAKYDWSQAGFFRYELTEQPAQGPARPAEEEAQQ